MPTEVTILAMRKLPTMDPKRRGQNDCIIAFRLENDPGRPDHVVIPKEQPTDAEIQAAIKARLAERTSYEGKKFTL